MWEMLGGVTTSAAPPGSPTPFQDLLVDAQNFQVFLSNSGTDRKFPPWTKRHRHPVDWVGFFVPPGHLIEECRTWVPEHYWAIERLIIWAQKNDPRRVDGLVFDAADTIAGYVPDAGSLQQVLDSPSPGVITPADVASLIRKIVDKYFPPTKFGGARTKAAAYKPPGAPRAIKVKMPLRAVAALVTASLVCEEANRGDMWYRTNVKKGTRIKLGGCRMVEGIYLYRRFTNSTYDQISTILRAHVGP